MVVAINWTEPSQIDQMWIQTPDKWAESDRDRGIDLRQGLIGFNYYESLFSPNVTATLSFLDSGNIADLGAGGDIQQRPGTVFDNLPLRGNEVLRPKITSYSGVLDFDTYPLIVDHITRTPSTNLKQIVTLNLVSKFAHIDKNKKVQKKYYGNIGNSVSQILRDELDIPSDRIRVEQTSNALSFPGNSLKPFDVIRSLGPKSTPIDGASGFFFYENYDGFNFRAVDSLITIGSPYVYTADLDAVVPDEPDPNWESDPNYRVLAYRVVKHESVTSKLESGTFGSELTQFNFASSDHVVTNYNTSDGGLSNTLGSELYTDELFKTNYWNLEENQSNSVGSIALEQPGSQEPNSGFSGNSTFNLNNDSRNHVANSRMRYNTIYTTVIDAVVPCNVNLRAGATVNMKFIKLSAGNLNEGNHDEALSGRYLILHLAHKFTREANNSSTTHMTIIRDTLGLYTPEVG